MLFRSMWSICEDNLPVVCFVNQKCYECLSLFLYLYFVRNCEFGSINGEYYINTSTNHDAEKDGKVTKGISYLRRNLKT